MADARKFVEPSWKTIKSPRNSPHSSEMKCFACLAVTEFCNREKNRSPSLVIAPNRHTQLHCPDSSTDGRDPRGNNTARVRLERKFWFSTQIVVASSASCICELIVELVAVARVGFGVCSARFLATQAHLFHQLPVARERIFHIIRFLEMAANEIVRPRWRVKSNFTGCSGSMYWNSSRCFSNIFRFLH